MNSFLFRLLLTIYIISIIQDYSRIFTMKFLFFLIFEKRIEWTGIEGEVYYL